jgi:uncharacterized membrane-anchored protein
MKDAVEARSAQPAAGEPRRTVPALPERTSLVDELHNRPPSELNAPVRLSHLAVRSGEAPADDLERAHLSELCRRFSAPLPAEGAGHHSVPLGRLHLRWERHTEFSTYTFSLPGAAEELFAANAADLLPGDWLANMPGSVIGAVHLVVEPDDGPPRGDDDLTRLFEGHRLVGSFVSRRRAQVWSAFRLHGDGFGRILVRTQAMAPEKLGRLVQRLLEIDTYRTTALLALPVARATAPVLTRLESELATLTAKAGTVADLAEQRTLLDALCRLAAEIERLSAENGYRFGAARAYSGIVTDRIAALREETLDDLQPIGDFLRRRFAPAMQTCFSVQDRQERLSAHIARAVDLLRARVDVALEEQNQTLLASMDRRARMQLALQQTVEGLSTFAISYYAVGLLNYVFKALERAVPFLRADVLTALALPVVVLTVWLSVRRLRHTLGERDRTP